MIDRIILVLLALIVLAVLMVRAWPVLFPK